MRLGPKYGFQVVFRSGGHSYKANGLGGKNGSFAVDMGNFNTVSVDPTTHIATISPGNRLISVALALNATGRAMPHGAFPYVGIDGHSGMLDDELNVSKLTDFVCLFVLFWDKEDTDLHRANGG
ncbi:hypothetical protein BDN70DRAFT_881638 [Pholiota conissans]|uniref:FAD linked oxidase N-terminal domain-containing protein n=1 Tax=Pholiota conissans TaxID=109636 RepID=A0A9P5YWE2_9AGAR|nr:hypothetical protein BDN70DRAFT_881638 [Pholiota conissans]